MAERKYFVNNGQSNVGPFDLRAIIEKVNRGDLKATDHICVDVDSDEWILICQHPEFIQHYEAGSRSKPTLKEESTPSTTTPPEPASANVIRIAPNAEAAPFQAAAEETRMTQTQSIIMTPTPAVGGPVAGGDLTSAEWYVLKGKNRFGPFMYLDVIRMLQEKSVFEYDYVWCNGLDTWKRIAQVACFSADYIRGLFADNESAEVFHRRNYKRSKYETTIIAHDNKCVWRGKTYEVSEGGAGIVIENAMILPGQSVYIHFKPGPLSKPFNVLCEIVSKRYMGGLKESGAPVIYGIKFINITKQDKEAIRNIHSAA